VITSRSSPRSGRICADHHRSMLKALRDRPLMVGTAEVLVDAARYITTVQLVLLLMGAHEGRALKQHR
jgi:hypothetical protein